MSATVCSACGLPPLPNKPLLKCTRCESVWYHDRACQVNHYPKHKAECRRVAKLKKKVNNTSTTLAVKQKPLVECRNIEGRGRSLFATTSIKVGCHPLSSDGLCKPIAHPVLLESVRSSRCTYCFQQFKHGHIQSSKLHCHCSLQCQRLDTNWRVEKHALQQLPSPPSPTALSCLRILRKFTETPSALNEYNELCYNIDSLSQQENESYLQIFNQAHIFLRATGDTTTAKMAYDMISNTTQVYQFMSRMCMNGFTISNSEQHAIGHGVYCGYSSMMNHTCRPNAVQTFWLNDNTPPMLQVTVCKDVNVGEEITISYCDTSTPTSIRRATLLENYKFVCDCNLCKDIDRNDDVIGLKCTTNSGGCAGRVKTIGALNESESSEYKCNACKSTDFNKARKAQSDSIDRMRQLESIMNNTQQHNKKVGVDIRKLYDDLKKYCCMKRSYYLSSSADLYINWCANTLKQMDNEQEQLKICHDALVVINESRQVSQFIMDYPGNLSWSVKLGVEAKLRLFANPADMAALQMLQDVRKELIKYYPSSDEMILSLEESLAAYSFS